jgi:hypothetical protein
MKQWKDEMRIMLMETGLHWTIWLAIIVLLGSVAFSFIYNWISVKEEEEETKT